MTQITFNRTLALSLYQSNEPYPIDLDVAWQWLGYAEKRNCLDTLKSSFEQSVDFSSLNAKTSTGGRPRNCIMLTIDCFKSLGMMAGTEQGKAIRKYFLECERIAKAAAKPTTSLRLIDTSKLDALNTKAGKLQEEVRALETRLASIRNELQNIRMEEVAIAKALITSHPDVVKHAIKCNEILEAYGDGNKYFSNPLKK
ncbi:hypothetical protein [Nostoc sp.]|uniref:hypothetical protein n=1 Tax=Nostoc sp. TaxID=1180 RepID=UPI002FF4D82E